MEAALVACKVECSKKNVFLNREIAIAKAQSLYRKFAAMATEDTRCGDEDNIKDQRPRNSSCSQSKRSFSTSRWWFTLFMKR